MTDLNIDFTDYKTILSHKGKISGIVDSCIISELTNCLDKSIKNSLSNAKGILINFKLHKEHSLFVINDIMAEIYNLTNNDVNIIFSTEQLDTIKKDILSYEIIITGL